MVLIAQTELFIRICQMRHTIYLLIIEYSIVYALYSKKSYNACYGVDFPACRESCSDVFSIRYNHDTVNSLT